MKTAEKLKKEIVGSEKMHTDEEKSLKSIKTRRENELTEEETAAAAGGSPIVDKNSNCNYTSIL